MQAKIKVAFFPYGLTQANPYQNLIIQGLENNGVEVIKVPGIKFFRYLHLNLHNRTSFMYFGLMIYIWGKIFLQGL